MKRLLLVTVAVLTLLATGTTLRARREVVAAKTEGAGEPAGTAVSAAPVMRADALREAAASAVIGTRAGIALAGARASAEGEDLGAPTTVDPEAYQKNAPLSEKEKQSVRALVGTILGADRGKARLNAFLADLEARGLKPIVAKDENPYTGKMLTIRTGEALEGTRYLHAQWFQDESANQEPFRQHVSFEVRNSPDAMQVARALVQELGGPGLGAPLKSTDTWTEWRVGHHSIWIRRLNKDDLANNPFNAHAPGDEGTVQVAKELIPEDDDGEVIQD